MHWRFGTRHWPRTLFLAGLLLCLGLAQVPQVLSSTAVEPVSIAQAAVIEQGLERYRSGDLPGAIALWKTGLQGTLNQDDRIKTLRYLARAEAQIGHLEQAIAWLDQLLNHYQQSGEQIQIGRLLTEQAQLHSSLGQPRRAIALLCGNTQPPTQTPTCAPHSALTIARQHSDREGEAAALGSLGNVHRLQGNYEEAEHYLKASLTIAQQTSQVTYQISALNGLGNTHASLAKRNYRYLQFAEQASDESAVVLFRQRAIANDRSAIDALQRSLSLSRAHGDAVNQVRSLLNLVLSYHRTGLKEASHSVQAVLAALLQQAQQLLNYLPDSREKAYETIRLAMYTQLLASSPETTDADLSSHCASLQPPAKVTDLLNQAIQIAQRIQDQQAESFALGRLGHIAECRQDYDRALSLTQTAQLVTQIPPSRYLWEWQTGRILKAQGKPLAAIAAYQNAVQTLKGIRDDIAVAGRDFQFDFRDTIEPIYRELAELQLNQAGREYGAAKTTEKLGEKLGESVPQQLIRSALDTIDSLRLAELQNYLGGDCEIEVFPRSVTSIASRTAVFNSIVLSDRVAVILTLPSSTGRQSRLYWIAATTQEVAQQVNQLRLKLEQRSDLTNAYRAPAQQLYDWLIRPFAADLQKAQIDTLVFIHDGVLRSVPMAALHSGTQFLVQQYAVANALSLALVKPTVLNPRELRVLAYGLTEPAIVDGPQFFEPLSYVKSEILGIQAAIPNSKGLIDRAFSRDSLQKELTEQAYPIVHMATHGRFGYDSRDTFLVTGEPWQGASQQESKLQQTLTSATPSSSRPTNEKLTLSAFYRLIHSLPQGNPLELLTLTACETAAGSDRDALGIAGLSVQAGAQSTVASLWQVDDQATAQLIIQFYQNLRQGASRAQALQFAQTVWLQQQSGSRSHPGYWAALVLVGNWL
jgi:CHAT domain-containing protein